MRLFYFILILKSILAFYPQSVGINNSGLSPDVSAGLDINFTNKGLLIPRVTLQGENDATTIPNPATSLLVYNTGTGGLQPAGFYYNQGTPASPLWTRLPSHSETWNTTGNSATDPNLHFLGTTDATDLIFKTNHQERMRISHINGNIGIGTSNPTDKLDIEGNIKFSGLLKPNNNPGSTGDVLVSQGASSPPIWTSAIKGTLAGAWEVSPLTAISTSSFSWENTDLTLNFFLPRNCTVYMYYTINVQPNGNPGVGYIQTRLIIDGTPDRTTASHYQPFCSGDCNVNISGVKVMSMSSGNHSVTLQWKVTENPIMWSSNPNWCDGYCAARKLVVMAFYE
ncbi:MAG: hypothetical protein N2Z72_08805 [Bacteroidales bacterium]|nr:hypothetical protein [Bacteroidales bacterium]